jgi:hypothetical protein
MTDLTRGYLLSAGDVADGEARDAVAERHGLAFPR